MFQYTNSRGASYYLHRQPNSKAGVRYTLNRSKEGAELELPAGYEVVENVNGQASIRLARARLVTVEEEMVVRTCLKEHGLDAYRAEVKERHLTVFAPDSDPKALAATLDPFDLPAGLGSRLEAMVREQLGDAAVDEYTRQRRAEFEHRVAKVMRYSPVLRFSLADAQRRLFAVSRMTYRGEGGWHWLGTMPLAKGAQRYVKHLGKESFFELF
jgi:hypothetical protein